MPICNKCNEDKPKDRMARNRSGTLRPRCKDCENKREKESRARRADR